MPAIRRVSRAFLFLVLASGAASAAEDTVAAYPPTAGSASQDVAAAEAATIALPAGTELVFEMLDTVNSKTARRGDRFSLKLAEPVTVDGNLLIPAGTLALGEVVHADRARGSGQAGELILAARTLEISGQTIALRAFGTSGSGTGADKTGKAGGLSVAFTPAAFMIRGGEKEMPAGSLISAKTRLAVALPALPVAAQVAATAEDTTTSDAATAVHDNNQGKSSE